MKGKACIWFQGYSKTHHDYLWEEMACAACKWLGEPNDGDLIEEFGRITQTSSVEEYIDKYQELRSIIMNQMSQVTMQYYVSVFVNGLKEELIYLVKMFRPPR